MAGSLATAACLDWPNIAPLDEGALLRRLAGQPARPIDFVLPDYGRLHQELRRKGMTLL